MRTGAWKYQSDEYQAPIWFRGYVERYKENKRIRISCEQVRKSRGEALNDAKKLLKKLKIKS